MSLENETRVALNRIMDPELRRSVLELGVVRDLEVSNQHVSFTFALPTLASLRKYETVEQALAVISRLDGCRSVTINLVGMTPEERQKIIEIARQRNAPSKGRPETDEVCSKAEVFPLQIDSSALGRESKG